MPPLSRAEKIAELDRCQLPWRDGSLTESEHMLAHQCYCTTEKRGAAGLAAFIFKSNPEANVYTHRIQASVPGTASFHATGVVNLYAQFYPGVVTNRESPYGVESCEQRLAWLCSALSAAKQFVHERGEEHLAVPAGLGCELAGGDWSTYCDALKQWQDENKDLTLVFYVL